MSDLTIKQGDLEPGLRVGLLDSGGAAINLTDALSVKLRFANSRRVEVWERDGIVDDAITGAISYDWQTGDTDLAGLFYAEFVVIWFGNRPQTYPPSGYVQVLIEPKL